MNTEHMINIAERDELFLQFGGKKSKEQEIQKQQIKRIQQIAEDNPYLKQVHDEMKNNEIISEKKRQEKIKHLEKLVDYIDDLIINVKSDSGNRIQALKHEKTRIKKEISKIKRQK
tara:strand:+ start:96 stop:443 length:348 start_codon:yes stop_codon:yes gene_type:complete